MKQSCLFIFSSFIIFACNDTDGAKETQQIADGSPVVGCYNAQTTDKAWYTSGKKAPVLKGLEGIDFKISTASPEAQAFFNQGMMLAYGFNHAEAARSFMKPPGWIPTAPWVTGDLLMCWGRTTMQVWKKIIFNGPMKRP